MRVKDGRLVLPSGMSYRYLLLPKTDRMTPALARKIRELADGGARIIASQRLQGAPGLTDYPHCDAEVQKVAAALWDGGRVVSGQTLGEVFTQDGLSPDFEGEGLQYIHRRVGETDVYFVSQYENCPREATCIFRVAGKGPELWDPETGQIRPLPEFAEKEGGRTAVPLRFEPAQSCFVVFRKTDRPASHGAVVGRNFPPRRQDAALAGPWQVAFDPKWGGPAGPLTFDKLEDWSQHADAAIRYYSGTAVYRTTFNHQPPPVAAQRLFLDLGKVEVMARVRLNGKDCGIAWKPPYLADITDAVRPGSNDLEIDVVNLWINRMIGDEQLPLDANWKDFETLLEWPDWFKNGTPRPSGRCTFSSCRHYQKDSPLIPSGLLGPVTIQSLETTVIR